MSAIRAKGLSKTYWFYEKETGLAGSLNSMLRGKKKQVEAVRQINLDFGTGEIVGFIGPNGAGKTTTLKMLSGILYPTAGTLEVLGHIPAKRDKVFLKQITFLSGQRNRLFWDLPAAEYFEFCRVMYEIPQDVFSRNKKMLIDLADIGEILNVPQRKLSFGQRKRCELAAGLLHDPGVIFLDEPTNAMDLINARKIRQFIRRLGGEAKYTVMLTSHNMADIEQVCRRVVVINRGKIAFDGEIGSLQKFGNSHRQIRVVLDGKWELKEVEKLAAVSAADGQEIVLDVAPERTADLVSEMMKRFPVRDISITEPKIENVIEKIFEQKEKD